MTQIAKSNIPRKVATVGGTPLIIGSRATTRIVKAEQIVKVANSVIGSNVDMSRFRYHKTPTPATDGAQKVFTLPDGEQYVSGLLEVYRDQLYLFKDIDFTETTSATFTLTDAPAADEDLRISYIKEG